ncbi:MAG TPA: DUF4149 domain-containing protein [Thermoanaerobaculia bacterium]
MVAALWLGSGAFLLAVAAPAAFRAAGNPTIAANVVGAMLGAWHYISIALPVILLALEWRRARAVMVVILFAGVVFGATQIAVDLRIRALRESSIIPISSLPHTDPIRRRFGALHGISSILLLAQVIVAAGAVGADTES